MSREGLLSGGHQDFKSAPHREALRIKSEVGFSGEKKSHTWKRRCYVYPTNSGQHFMCLKELVAAIYLCKFRVKDESFHSGFKSAWSRGISCLHQGQNIFAIQICLEK